MKNTALFRLVKTGILELLREPKTLFFIIVFPLLFLGMFAATNSVAPPTDAISVSLLEFMFPGVLIFALVASGMYGTSTPLIELRKKGTLRLLHITPLRKETFIASQIIVRFLVGILQVILFLFAGFLMDLISVWTILPVFIVSLLGITMILLLGFIFGTLFNSVELAGGVLGGMVAPVLMISGVLFPLYILPDIFVTIAKVIPFTYLADLLRWIMYPEMGAMFPVYINILVLISFTIAFFFIGKRTFNWESV